MQDRILSLAKEFIRIPSVTGDSKESAHILQKIKQYLPEFPYQDFLHNNNQSVLFTNKKAYTKQFTIILNAHLDVVPAKEKQFEPYEKDGKLYGRGTFDMKAAAAVLLDIFKEIAPQVSYPLGLQLVTDEEIGGKVGTKYQLDQGVQAKFTIVGEPTKFNIVNQSKGRIILKLTSYGMASHSAYPWLGENAIWKMNNALAELMRYFPPPLEESNNTTINIAQIETTNDIPNQVPDNCTTYLDIRSTPDEHFSILKKITTILPEEIDIQHIHSSIPHQTRENNPYILTLKEISENMLHKNIVLKTAHGTSDLRFFTAKGYPGIEFGPMGGGHHSDNEWVDIQSLTDYANILKQFLLSIEKNMI